MIKAKCFTHWNILTHRWAATTPTEKRSSFVSLNGKKKENWETFSRQFSSRHESDQRVKWWKMFFAFHFYAMFYHFDEAVEPISRSTANVAHNFLRDGFRKCFTLSRARWLWRLFGDCPRASLAHAKRVADETREICGKIKSKNLCDFFDFHDVRPDSQLNLF